MIIGQTLFQVAATFILHFGGPHFLPYPDDQMRSMIFNMFVWLQISNQYNNRRLDNRLNIFVGIHKNYYFIAMNVSRFHVRTVSETNTDFVRLSKVIMVAAQVCIAMYGSTAFSIVRINGNQWAISVTVAVLCVPWGVAVRLFPDEWFGVVAHVVGSPFVFAYRPCAKVAARVMKKLKRSKNVKGEKDVSDVESFEGRGKAPVEIAREKCIV